MKDAMRIKRCDGQCDTCALKDDYKFEVKFEIDHDRPIEMAGALIGFYMTRYDLDEKERLTALSEISEYLSVYIANNFPEEGDTNGKTYRGVNHRGNERD